MKSPAIIHIVDGLHAIACIIFPSMPCSNLIRQIHVQNYCFKKRINHSSSISPVSPSNKNVLSVMSDLIPIAMPHPALSKPPY